MRGEKRFELALWMQGRGGEQPGVDAHRHLVDNACRVGYAIGGLEDGAGDPRGGQEVGHGGRCDQRTRRRVRQ